VIDFAHSQSNASPQSPGNSGFTRIARDLGRKFIGCGDCRYDSVPREISRMMVRRGNEDADSLTYSLM
jgi:hypothetical protein